MSILDYATDPLVKASQLKVKDLHQVRHVLTTGGIYGENIEFKLNKSIEKLAQDYLQFDLTIVAASFNTLHLAACIMSSIRIETTSGRVVLDEIRPERIFYELEKMGETNGFYQFITSENNQGIDAPLSFTTLGDTTCTLRLPLMFFYTMNWSEYLDIRETEQLYIRGKVNTLEGMRMTTSLGAYVPLTGLTISLYQEYYVKNVTYSGLFQNGPGLTVSRPLRKTYSVWYEKPIALDTGSTRYEYLLKCNVPTNNIIAMILGPRSIYKITSYNLKLNTRYVVGNEFTYIPTGLDYNFSNKMVGYSQVKHLSYFFDQYSNNVVDSTDFITFSKESNLYPAYLTINYAVVPAGTYLYIFHEVPTKYMVDTNRQISTNDMTVPNNYVLNDGRRSRA